MGFKAVTDRSGFFSCSRIGFYLFCPVQQGRIRKSLPLIINHKHFDVFTGNNISEKYFDVFRGCRSGALTQEKEAGQ